MAKQAQNVVRSGELLIEQFRSAMMTLATVDQAKHIAKQSEQETLSSLASLPSQNSYVTPNDIPTELEAAVAQSSLNAHLQKVQSEQMAVQGSAFVSQMEADVLKTYKGRKVRVSVLEPKLEPVEAYGYDGQSGHYYLTKARPRSFSGVIEDVRLDSNMLVLRPSMLKQLFSGKIAYYIVFAINPQTLQPLIRLSLI